MVTPVQNMGPTMVPPPGNVGAMPPDPAGQNMQQFAEATGRGGDKILGHLTPGEIVIPMDAQTEEVIVAVRDAFEKAGMNPREYVVGDAENRINPQTGNPEYFSFSSLNPFKRIKKLGKKIKKSKFLRTAIPLVASMFLPMLAPALMANPLMAAGINYTTNRLVGNDHKSSLMGAAMAGVGTGVANKAAGSTFMGGGAEAGASTNFLTGAPSPQLDPINTMTAGDAGANIFGSGVTGGATLAQTPVIPSSTLGMEASMVGAGAPTLGAAPAGVVTGAAGQMAGSATGGMAQAGADEADKQKQLAEAAMAKFNKPLPQLTEDELRELMNDPLNRDVSGGIYEYA